MLDRGMQVRGSAPPFFSSRLLRKNTGLREFRVCDMCVRYGIGKKECTGRNRLGSAGQSSRESVRLRWSSRE